MRLSEAIRLGAMLKPQALALFDVSRGGSCAVGAAMDACGALDEMVRSRNPSDWYENWTHRFALLRQWPIACPVCEAAYRTRGDSVIAHLNDRHRWTREQIADWVESIEARSETSTAVATPAAAVDPVEGIAELTPVHARETF